MAAKLKKGSKEAKAWGAKMRKARAAGGPKKTKKSTRGKKFGKNKGASKGGKRSPGPAFAIARDKMQSAFEANYDAIFNKPKPKRKAAKKKAAPKRKAAAPKKAAKRATPKRSVAHRPRAKFAPHAKARKYCHTCRMTHGLNEHRKHLYGPGRTPSGLPKLNRTNPHKAHALSRAKREAKRLVRKHRGRI